jgi:glycosyltransferase involved in cell wall biosynthesis
VIPSAHPSPAPGSSIRVLAVLDGYQVTGPARQLLSTAAYLRGSGIQTTIALFSRVPGPSPLVRAAGSLRVPVVPLPDRFPGDPGAIRALSALYAGADVVQTHGYKANVLTRSMVRRHRRPWVAFLHGDTWQNWKVRAYFALERRAVRQADRIVSVSEALAREVRESGGPSARVRVVPNASVAESPAAPPQAWERQAEPRVGVLGRLSPEKGVDLALRAHALVRGDHPASRLVVAGEGPEGPALRRLAGQLGVAETVEWLGHLEDVTSLYAGLTVVLIPSRSEGMPNVALEAMAHGVPIVAAAVGGVPEVLRDGRTGVLVPPGHVSAMARGVGELLADADRRRALGAAAQREARERFSVAARGATLITLYRELLGWPS